MSIQAEISTFSSGSSTSSLSRISADTVPSSVGSAASSLRGISLDASLTSPLILEIEDDVRFGGVQETKSSAQASTIRQACRYDCYCMCHALSAADSIKGVSKLGGLQGQYTEPSCQCARSSEKKAVIPSFFRRAIAEVISSRSIKVRFHLNTYRMVSEGSDALRYVKHGNLEKLKLCIQTGEATLWDTAPDGWSLLHVSSAM
jgi:hypothetical protein